MEHDTREYIGNRKIMAWEPGDLIVHAEKLREIADSLRLYTSRTAQEASVATENMARYAERYEKTISQLLEKSREAWNILCMAEDDCWDDDKILCAFVDIDIRDGLPHMPVEARE